MITMEVIKPAQTEWESLIGLVPKDDDNVRFCVDYRTLNAVTIRDSYPVLRMHGSVDLLGDATIFSMLYAINRYWKVEITESNRGKRRVRPNIAFTDYVHAFWVEKRCMDDLTSDERLIIELQMAVSTCKSTLNRYILAYARRTYRPCTTVFDVAIRIWREMKVNECKPFINQIDYLGHVTRPGHFEVSTRMIDAIHGLENQTIRTELRAFLGLCHILRRFVPIFVCIAASMSKELPKDQLQKFDGLIEDKIPALETLNAKLVEPPVLALPHFASHLYHGCRCMRHADRIFCRKNLTVPTDQLDFNPFRVMTPSTPIKPRIESVSLWCGQCYCCESTWRDADVP